MEFGEKTMRTKDVDKKVNRAKPLFSLDHCRRQLSIAIIALILLSTISTLFIPLIGANRTGGKTVEIPSLPEDTHSPSQGSQENINPTSEASEPDEDDEEEDEEDDEEDDEEEDEEDEDDDKSLSDGTDKAKNPIINNNPSGIEDTPSTETNDAPKFSSESNGKIAEQTNANSQNTPNALLPQAIANPETDKDSNESHPLKNDSYFETIGNNASNANNANNKNNGLKINNSFIFEETTEEDEDNTVKKIASNLGNISKGQEISVTINKETPSTTTQVQRTTIERVWFKASSSQANVELSVKNLKEKPAEVTNNLSLPDQSRFYEYLDIKLTSEELYIGSTAVSSMNFTFTVEKSWIRNESIDKETVRMMRYHNDTWQTLDTIYVNETEDTIRYISTTPGLSIFAVAGDTIVEETDDVIIESFSIPYWISISIISVLTTTLGIVLFKKRFVYKS